MAAEKSGRKIAVEIKSFVGPSPMRELELALGQFVLYRGVLAIVDPERRLYMAVPDDIYASLFASQFGQLVIREAGLSLFTFEVATELGRLRARSISGLFSQRDLSQRSHPR